MIKETRNEDKPLPYEEIPLPARRSGAVKLNRNVAFLMLLMVCLASIHNQSLPSGQTVLTAVQQTVDSDWDETLGQITFVDQLIPDTLAVFFAQPASQRLSLPCVGSVAHSWSQDAPYVSYVPQNKAALAMADGEVMNISHGADDLLTLRIRHDSGLESVYYHLEEVFCREGDIVKCGDTIATICPGENLVVDVRQDGLSVDPAGFISGAT